jgi:hypothetical protein
MTNLFKLKIEPLWQGSFSLFKMPDGSMRLALDDVRSSLIENGKEPWENLEMLAAFARDGAVRLLAEVKDLKPLPHS